MILLGLLNIGLSAINMGAFIVHGTVSNLIVSLLCLFVGISLSRA